jgi:DNA-binding NtrC family response regulator
MRVALRAEEEETGMFDVLNGKKILVVDDEPDVCRFVGFELAECDVESAQTFDEAKTRFAAGRYDLVILDIMGVKGFDLLAEFSQTVPCIVLTARALSGKDLEQAIAGRAVLYLPKEELGRLDEYVARALEMKSESLWPWLFSRLDFRRWFGPKYEPPLARPGGAD